MSIELPKDAEGREIPLDTVVLFGGNNNAYNITGWIYVTDFDLNNSTAGQWRALTDKFTRLDPELMYLTPSDSWEKLLEDLGEAGDARYYEACAYFHRDKDEDGCTSCPGGEDGCARIAMRDIAYRIRKPTCLDLVDHKQDPFIPGKRMVDGYFHCSDCGWDGRIWEHIGFGDMLAYEAVHCPKCGAIIKRCA